MDFELTDDQVSLQEGMRAFVEGRFAPDAVRAIEADGGRLDRERWQELGDTGVFSLRLAEADGGVGLGAAEAVLVFEELGRALVPGPLVASELAARFRPGAASGAEVVALLALDGRIDGPAVLEHPDDLDALIVLERDAVRMVAPADVAGTDAARPLDALTPVRAVTDGLPRGEVLGGAELARGIRRDGAVLTAALQLGIASRTVELATAYAKEREQFGRPIGSFQAVKHIVADMLVRAEVARAAVYAAACAVDGRSDDDPDRAAAAAKVVAGEAALANAKWCIQVHGGIGYTWELDVQRYWKRACVLDTHFGDADHWAEVVAATI
jgi:alkylation response protein AidB-like acyl-CoA dehydrogenase